MDRRVIGLLAFGGVLLVAVVAVVVGRGGDDDGGGDAGSETTAAVSPADKPEVEIPGGAPPKELVSDDLEPGDGDEAQAGDLVSVQYVGVLFDGGEEFDASYDRGEPFQFRLGAGEVIDGWDQGVEGMKVGGRRQLVIPPDLAYGKQGQPPTIPPNSTLVFVIDLVSID